jgi:hypothetical protein
MELSPINSQKAVIPQNFLFAAGERKFMRNPICWLSDFTKSDSGSIFFRLRRRENRPE